MRFMEKTSRLTLGQVDEREKHWDMSIYFAQYMVQLIQRHVRELRRLHYNPPYQERLDPDHPSLICRMPYATQSSTRIPSQPAELC